MTAGASYVAALGRLLIAVIFLVSGVGKILAPAMTQGYIGAAGLPSPLAAYLIAIAVEVGGGTLLILGFQTRLAALALAIFSVAAAVGLPRLRQSGPTGSFFEGHLYGGRVAAGCRFWPGQLEHRCSPWPSPRDVARECGAWSYRR
jgi:uncharacterized membrane protein YphA (DoxX/SURF4 family)